LIFENKSIVKFVVIVMDPIIKITTVFLHHFWSFIL